MKHFHWMVIDGIDHFGIWFRTTKTRDLYVWYWNPVRQIKAWKEGSWSLGFFPLLSKHIWNND